MVMSGTSENHKIFNTKAWSFLDIHLKIEQIPTKGVHQDLTLTHFFLEK